MSPGLRRRAADLACRLLLASLPRHLRPWGEAVRNEVAHIPNHTNALFYALGSLGGVLPRALATHLWHPVVGHEWQQSVSKESKHMSEAQRDFSRPRRVAVVCGASAVLLGLAYLWLADAPSHYLAINSLALLIGFVLMAILDRLSSVYSGWRSAAIVGAAVVIMFTALLGQPVEGASRWVKVGAVFIQPSLILLPILVLAFAGAKGWLSTIGVLIAALALALQPDRAMAGALAASLIAIAMLRPDRMTITAATGALGCFAATLFRPDKLPAVPYVDQVLYTAFDDHVVAGITVLMGTFLLVLPALVGFARDPQARALYATHGIVWSAIILAATVGNYPTPIVGYGGSAILGYFLALAALPKTAGRRATEQGQAPGDPTVSSSSNPLQRLAASSA